MLPLLALKLTMRVTREFHSSEHLLVKLRCLCRPVFWHVLLEVAHLQDYRKKLFAFFWFPRCLCARPAGGLNSLDSLPSGE